MQPTERTRILNYRTSARHSVCGVGGGVGLLERRRERQSNRSPPMLARHGSTGGCSEPYDTACRVMLIGDSGVGKTSFLHQFKDSKFPGSTFITTVGVDYRSKILSVDGFRIRFQVWDTAGTERYRSISSAYYRDADAILLFYDITNRQSFNNVRNWLADIREHGSTGVYVMLLGNKSDADSDRKVTKAEGQQLAKDDQIAYFLETSAKTGHQVEQCHKIIGRWYLAKQNLLEEPLDSIVDKKVTSAATAGIKLTDPTPSSSKISDTFSANRLHCSYC